MAGRSPRVPDRIAAGPAWVAKDAGDGGQYPMSVPLTGHYRFTREMIEDTKPLWDADVLRRCYEFIKPIGVATTIGDNSFRFNFTPSPRITLKDIAQLDAAMSSMRWEASEDNARGGRSAMRFTQVNRNAGDVNNFRLGSGRPRQEPGSTHEENRPTMTPEDISKIDALMAEWKQNRAEHDRLWKVSHDAMAQANELTNRQYAIKAEILRMTCPDAFRDTLGGASQANGS
jgi:hypothetical protein